MKYFAAIIVLMVFIAARPVTREQSSAIEKLAEELPKYRLTTSIHEIPKRVYREINLWKNTHMTSADYPVTRKDKKRFRFDLAAPDAPYNDGCIYKRGLSFRQLVFAGQYGNKWVIIYRHGQGRFGNTKMLSINLDCPELISVVYISNHIDSFSDLGDHLNDLVNSDPDQLHAAILLLDGQMYPDSLDFERINF